MKAPFGRSHPFVLNVAFSGLVLCGNLGTGILAARLLGPTGRGEYAVALAWISGVAILGPLGLREASLIAGASARKGSLRHMASSVSISGVASTVLFAMLAIVGAMLLSPTSELATTLAFLCWVPPIMALSEVTYALMSAVERASLAAGLRVAAVFLYLLILASLALADAQPTALQLLATQGASLGASAAVAIVLFSRKIGFGRPNFPQLRTLFPIARRVVGLIVANVLRYRLDVLIISAVVGYGAVGLYSIAFNLSTVAPMVLVRLGDVLIPRLKLSARPTWIVWRTLGYIVSGATIAAILMASMAEWLLSLLYGPAFTAAAPTLRILLIAAVLTCASNLLVQALQALGLPGAGSLAEWLALIALVCALAILVPLAHEVGAAWAVVASASVGFIALIGLGRNHLVAATDAAEWNSVGSAK